MNLVVRIRGAERHINVHGAVVILRRKLETVHDGFALTVVIALITI